MLHRLPVPLIAAAAVSLCACAAPDESRLNFDCWSMVLPCNWQVAYKVHDHGVAKLKLIRDDSDATLEFTRESSELPLEDICQLKAKAYVDDGYDITQGPQVEFGTCVISGDADTDHFSLRLRHYSDEDMVYSIAFTGTQAEANEVLESLSGDERAMQLLIEPLTD